ncbi:hypothetical protein IWZ03DRAFT_105113 [Phyllosticta citriasiana]|uniref:Uncharacterized protein n=1 Tax=Phyllosticta citriasiana TaxID=595635 RepID=A0ABR1KXG7_9PEZI
MAFPLLMPTPMYFAFGYQSYSVSINRIPPFWFFFFPAVFLFDVSTDWPTTTDCVFFHSLLLCCLNLVQFQIWLKSPLRFLLDEPSYSKAIYVLMYFEPPLHSYEYMTRASKPATNHR